jgi:hypothetical protein
MRAETDYYKAVKYNEYIFNNFLIEDIDIDLRVDLDEYVSVKHLAGRKHSALAYARVIQNLRADFYYVSYIVYTLHVRALKGSPFSDEFFAYCASFDSFLSFLILFKHLHGDREFTALLDLHAFFTPYIIFFAYLSFTKQRYMCSFKNGVPIYHR